MASSSNPVLLTWTQAAQAINGLLQYNGLKDRFTLVDVMGYTGHAFRINIHRETVDAAGPTMFGPDEVVGDGLRIFGIQNRSLFYRTPATPEQLEHFINTLQESIDRGWPVVGWDLFVPEYGLIYGYDHEEQLLHARDVEKDGTIAYSRLNDRRYGSLVAITVTNVEPVEPLSMLRQALAFAVRFTRGAAQQPDSPFRHGLEGYDAWIEAFTGRRINIPGQAYNLAVVADAREFAVKFLRSLPEKWPGETPLERDIRSLAGQATTHYADVAAALGQMRLRFPFPQGGEPNDPGEAEAAVALLREARAAEEKGVQVLEQFLDRIQSTKA